MKFLLIVAAIFAIFQIASSIRVPTDCNRFVMCEEEEEWTKPVCTFWNGMEKVFDSRCQMKAFNACANPGEYAYAYTCPWDVDSEE